MGGSLGVSPVCVQAWVRRGVCAGDGEAEGTRWKGRLGGDRV